MQRKPLTTAQLVHVTTPQSPLCLHADEEEEPLDGVEEVEPLEGAEEEPLEGAEEEPGAEQEGIVGSQINQVWLL